MKLIVCFSFLIILFYSCDKQKKTAQEPAQVGDTYVGLSDEIKQFKVKMGSYWIFENDSSGVLDSVIVVGIDSNWVWTSPPVHGNSGTKSEYYKINYKSCLSNVFYNDYLINMIIKRNGGGIYGEMGQPIYWANASVGESFNGLEVVAKNISLTLNTTFDNVSKMKINKANQYQNEFSYDTYLYFSNTVGVIKKENVIGANNIEAWSLKRSHIVK